MVLPEYLTKSFNLDISQSLVLLRTLMLLAFQRNCYLYVNLIATRVNGANIGNWRFTRRCNYNVTATNLYYSIANKLLNTPCGNGVVGRCQLMLRIQLSIFMPFTSSIEFLGSKYNILEVTQVFTRFTAQFKL